MTSRDYESELAERFELIAEGYWVSGMSLDEARAKAAKATGERRDKEG